jgi:tetratricopeptide (TPR) repeat protein
MRSLSRFEYLYSLDEQFFHFKALQEWQKENEMELSPYQQFRYADVLRLCGSFSKSEILFRKIDIQKLSKNQKALYLLYLGHLYMNQGKKTKAISNLKKSIKFDPTSSIPYVFLGKIYIECEETDKAIEILLKVLTLKEGDFDEIYFNLSNCYAIKTLNEEALKAIESCLSLSPDFLEAQLLKSDLIECMKIMD